MTSTIQSQMESITISCPKVELKKLKGIVKAMGWVIIETKRVAKSESEESEWTEEQERDAFLCTSRFNAAQLFSI